MEPALPLSRAATATTHALEQDVGHPQCGLIPVRLSLSWSKAAPSSGCLQASQRMILTWVRKEQRDAFTKWVRDFADSTQNRKSRPCYAAAGVKFCTECEKHKALFKAEVHLETGWSDVVSKTFNFVVHGFRAKQETKGKTRKTQRANDDSSDTDGTPSHEGEMNVRRREFLVRDSALEVMCDVVECVNDDDPLMITSLISPGLQLLIGTTETGQDVCHLFAKAQDAEIETWLHDAYVSRAEGGQASSTNSFWCFLAMPALEISVRASPLRST
ncbi:unnamed protein product [Prorocentrum cordatum]|uniref:Uncharacterized protein n=1 Tax=Prorocentrum cordatum TaxID=2364126 RepID=A0ABN9X3T9_9DINO|nr:unnamed protein product [Polarella glacialis]